MSLAVSTSAPRHGSRTLAPHETGSSCSAAPTVPTMGVEEEFLLVDRRSRAPVGRAAGVIQAASGRLGPLVQPEFFTAQVESCTSPTSSTAVLRAELAWLRAELVRAAESQDCLLVGTGTPVIPPEHPLTITPDERYRRMAVRFASAVGGHDQPVCGCHVHIGVSSRAQALDLANRLRPWLPTLQALSANSPSTAAGTRAMPAGGRSNTPAGPRWGRRPSWTRPRTSASRTIWCSAGPSWTAG